MLRFHFSYLVKFSASRPGSDAFYTLECRFSQIQRLRVHDQSVIIERLWKLKVIMSLVTRKSVFGFSTRHDSNRPAQLQKLPRVMKLPI